MPTYISNLLEEYVYFNGTVEEPFTFFKTSRDSYFGLDLSMHVNENHMYLVTHGPLTERAISINH
jgi:hypothetical protein